MRSLSAVTSGLLPAFALLIVAPVMAIAQTVVPEVAPAPTDALPVDQQQKVAALLKLIADTIAAMPANSKGQDIEGRLSFAIDQAQPDCSTSKSALATATTDPKLTVSARQALRNISSVLSRCQNSGTAALAGAQTIVVQGTSLSLGGGTSDYVRP